MRSRAASFRAAWLGIVHATATQANFRIELAVGVIAVGFAWWLAAPLSPILLASALVLSLELVNTAVEEAIDLASPSHCDEARIAKDCAAGAVLLGALGAVAVGLVTLGPPLYVRLTQGAA